MRAVGEVAGGEKGGPCDWVSAGQCVEQLDCVFYESTFAICM